MEKEWRKRTLIIYPIPNYHTKIDTYKRHYIYWAGIFIYLGTYLYILIYGTTINDKKLCEF